MIPSTQTRTHYEGSLTPVVLDVNQTKLAALDPDLRGCTENIATAAEGRLREWETFDVSYPDSRFTDGSPAIRLRDVFKAPNNSELARLVTDEQGNSVSLTPQQRAQIRKTGTFVIPSEDYPGQNHVWKVSRILQKGSEPVRESLEGHQAALLDQLTVHLPQRLSRNGVISVGRGVHNLYQGLRGLLGFSVGVKAERAKFSPAHVEGEIHARRLTMIREYLVEVQEGDDRLYDEGVSKRLRGVIGDMENQWSTYLNANRQSWEQALLAEMADGDESGSTPTQSLKSALKEKIDQEYTAFIQNYEPIEKAEPGYGNLLVNAHRARKTAEDVQNDFAAITNQHAGMVERRIKEEHPIRSRSDRWRKMQVEQEVKKFSKAEIWNRLQEKATQLEDQGLALEAGIYRRVLEFQRDIEPVLRKSLEAEKVASRTFPFQTRIWRSKNWTKLEHDGPEGRVFSAVKYRPSEVKTDQLFWRLRLVKNQTVADFQNGLHSILVNNLWNGSLGLKSLVLEKPFHAKDRMDPTTGEIVSDEASTTHTLCSRLHALWARVAEERRQFEEEPDTGILPKKFHRWLNKAYHNGIKGGGGTALLVTGQPLLTTGNLVLSSALTVTTPLWAPLRSVAKYTLAPIIYDFNSPMKADNQTVRRFCPILGHTLYDAGITGLGQTALALSSAVVLHPAAAGTIGLYAGLRKYTRTGYDFAMAHTVLKWGRQPANDTWLSKRIQGPGLTQAYFFQVRPEIAVLGLQAELERTELQLFRQNVSGAITDPLKRYHQFFSNLVSSIGEFNIRENPTTKRLKEAETNRLRDLDDTLRERQTALSQISDLTVPLQRIRQLAADLETTIDISRELVSSFYAEKLEPYMDDEQVLAFWNRENLPVGDFQGLAKHYLVKVFSPNFLEPLEVTDEHFVIDVSNPDAKAFLRTLMHPGD